MVWFLYDPVTYYTDDEYKERNQTVSTATSKCQKQVWKVSIYRYVRLKKYVLIHIHTPNICVHYISIHALNKYVQTQPWIFNANIESTLLVLFLYNQVSKPFRLLNNNLETTKTEQTYIFSTKPAILSRAPKFEKWLSHT